MIQCNLILTEISNKSFETYSIYVYPYQIGGIDYEKYISRRRKISMCVK